MSSLPGGSYALYWPVIAGFGTKYAIQYLTLWVGFWNVPHTQWGSHFWSFGCILIRNSNVCWSSHFEQGLNVSVQTACKWTNEVDHTYDTWNDSEHFTHLVVPLLLHWSRSTTSDPFFCSARAKLGNRSGQAAFSTSPRGKRDSPAACRALQRSGCQPIDSTQGAGTALAADNLSDLAQVNWSEFFAIA